VLGNHPASNNLRCSRSIHWFGQNKAAKSITNILCNAKKSARKHLKLGKLVCRGIIPDLRPKRESEYTDIRGITPMMLIW